jgi:26S proteasome regulatory subunit N8
MGFIELKNSAETNLSNHLLFKMSSLEVVVHPLVLLSVVDHYNRVAKDTRKRVVGVLLGSRTKSRVDVTNSFAVPFEEDLANPKVWFLDHNFLDSMYWMFKKVNSKFFTISIDTTK